jgi:hypothetical protein
MQAISFNSLPDKSPLCGLIVRGSMRAMTGHSSGTTRNQIEQTKHKSETTMKKYILIAAAAIVTTLGVGYAASSIHNIADHSKCENFKCTFCGGTGWQKGSSFKCAMCKGTGANGSY